MYTGVGYFAAGVQALDFGAGPRVHEHATAHVVGCGHDGNPFLGNVDAGVKALRVDVGEVALDVLGRTAGKVDEHVWLAEAHHLAVDGTGHDVAGGEGMQRVDLVHEFFALVVFEDAAESADRFRDEEGFLELRGIQTCRVELHELNVLEGSACAGGNRHAVATTVVRAHGVLPDASGSARRKDGRLRIEVLDNAGLLVDNLCTDAALGLAGSGADEVLDIAVLEVVDVLLLVELAEERPHDFLAGEVCGVQNAVVAVAALKVEVKLRVVGRGRRELDSPFDELLDCGGPALGEDVNGLLLAETSACFQRVGDVEYELVRLFGDGCNTALGVVRRTVRLGPFC